MEINYQENIESSNMIISANDGQVLINGLVKKISPVNMKVLLLLIKNQGKVVSRTQIFDTVWPSQEVSDDTLTRCISDLRSQIGKEFIKTLPKRGYQWIPEVKQSRSDSNIPKLKMWPWVIYGLIGILIISMVTLWIANQMIKPNQLRIAILPINFTLTEQSSLASQTEAILKSAIIDSGNLKLLSSRILSEKFDKPFPYLSLEYGAKWVIEGNIKTIENNTIITLSLVDARTALVDYSDKSKAITQESDLLNFCDQFINKLNQFK